MENIEEHTSIADSGNTHTHAHAHAHAHTSTTSTHVRTLKRSPPLPSGPARAWPPGVPVLAGRRAVARAAVPVAAGGRLAGRTGGQGRRPAGLTRGARGGAGGDRCTVANMPI